MDSNGMSITKPIDLDQLEKETKHLPGFKVILVVLRELYEYSKESEQWVFEPEKVTEKVYNFILIYLEVLAIDAATITGDKEVIQQSKDIQEIIDKKIDFEDKYYSLIDYIHEIFSGSITRNVELFKKSFDIGVKLSSIPDNFAENQFKELFDSFSFTENSFVNPEVKIADQDIMMDFHISIFLFFFTDYHLDNLYHNYMEEFFVASDRFEEFFLFYSILKHLFFKDYKKNDYLLCDKSFISSNFIDISIFESKNQNTNWNPMHMPSFVFYNLSLHKAGKFLLFDINNEFWKNISIKYNETLEQVSERSTILFHNYSYTNNETREINTLKVIEPKVFVISNKNGFYKSNFDFSALHYFESNGLLNGGNPEIQSHFFDTEDFDDITKLIKLCLNNVKVKGDKIFLYHKKMLKEAGEIGFKFGMDDISEMSQIDIHNLSKRESIDFTQALHSILSELIDEITEELDDFLENTDEHLDDLKDDIKEIHDFIDYQDFMHFVLLKLISIHCIIDLPEQIISHYISSSSNKDDALKEHSDIDSLMLKFFLLQHYLGEVHRNLVKRKFLKVVVNSVKEATLLSDSQDVMQIEKRFDQIDMRCKEVFNNVSMLINKSQIISSKFDSLLKEKAEMIKPKKDEIKSSFKEVYSSYQSLIQFLSDKKGIIDDNLEYSNVKAKQIRAKANILSASYRTLYLKMALSLCNDSSQIKTLCVNDFDIKTMIEKDDLYIGFKNDLLSNSSFLCNDLYIPATHISPYILSETYEKDMTYIQNTPSYQQVAKLIVFKNDKCNIEDVILSIAETTLKISRKAHEIKRYWGNLTENLLEMGDPNKKIETFDTLLDNILSSYSSREALFRSNKIIEKIWVLDMLKPDALISKIKKKINDYHGKHITPELRSKIITAVDEIQILQTKTWGVDEPKRRKKAEDYYKQNAEKFKVIQLKDIAKEKFEKSGNFSRNIKRNVVTRILNEENKKIGSSTVLNELKTKKQDNTNISMFIFELSLYLRFI